MVTTRKECSSTETVTPAYEKVFLQFRNSKSEMIHSNTKHEYGSEGKRRARNNQEFLNVKEKNIYLI